jgi:transient receptor potential cation channel subfamily C protein 4
VCIQFVAHPHTQQLLATLWYEGLPGWRKRTFLVKLLLVLGLVAGMPIMAVSYLLFPRSAVGQLVRKPFIKFMYHSATFVVFLCLLILASTNVTVGDAEYKLRKQQRGPAPTPLEWLILLYVTGFVWSECKQLWEEGLKAYVRQWWNWLDFIMLSLYLCTFSLRLVAFAPLLLPRAVRAQHAASHPVA